MKEIVLDRCSNFPYLNTDVTFEESITAIKGLLKKFKCGDEILVHESGRSNKIAFRLGGVPYIIESPIIYIEGKKTPKHLAMEISGRVVYNEIKAILVNVEVGITDFMQGMLRYIALPSPDGLTTLGEIVEKQKEKIISGHQIEFDPTKIKALMGEASVHG